MIQKIRVNGSNRLRNTHSCLNMSYIVLFSEKTLEGNGKLNIELTVEKGKGYVPAEGNKKPRPTTLVSMRQLSFQMGQGP